MSGQIARGRYAEHDSRVVVPAARRGAIEVAVCGLNQRAAVGRLSVFNVEIARVVNVCARAGADTVKVMARAAISGRGKRIDFISFSPK